MGDLQEKIPRAEIVELESVLMKVKDANHPELKLMICGSYRRMEAASGDIDVLITSMRFKSDHPTVSGTLLNDLVKSLQVAAFITDTLAHGRTKYMGVRKLGIPGSVHRRIDIRCLPWDQFYWSVVFYRQPRKQHKDALCSNRQRL